MPFNPSLPAAGSEISSAELREQFTGLKDIFDAIPAPVAETDPVFAASEAASFAPGDKAKLDSAVQRNTTPGIAFAQDVDNTVFFPAMPGKVAVSYDVGSTSVRMDGP